MSYNSSVIFHLNLCMLWTNKAQQIPKFHTFRLTKLLMSFLKLQISLPLNFASPFSLMTHNYSEIPEFKNYMLWKKRAHQYAAFQTFIFHTTSSGSI